MLREAEPDLAAFAAFPPRALEEDLVEQPRRTVHCEVKCRANVVQVFPNRDSATRLIGAVLLEQHEEWQYGERRYLSDISMRRLLHALTDHNTPGAITA